jgi:hypothetical protein
MRRRWRGHAGAQTGQRRDVVPLATVIKGQQRSITSTPTARSAPATVEIPTLPKLVVRVRFPLPARASQGATPAKTPM